MIRFGVLLILAIFWMFVSACGPGWSTISLADAREAVAEMDAAQAKDVAPYEYYSALLYLDRAQEKNAYAQFQTAAEFAEKSYKMAKEARKKALAKRELAGMKEEELEKKVLVEEKKKSPVEDESMVPGMGLPAGSMFGKGGSPPPSLSPQSQGIAPVEEEEEPPPFFSTPPSKR
ncbi:MAG: hypothetical protein Kow0090_19590 [Myxococcota bacterium]